jgi:uncharacterized membrane protein YeaQ/YmgE (transglycosylase-associated protein family)
VHVSLPGGVVPRSEPDPTIEARTDSRSSMLPIMLILGLILFGMLVGAGAQLILGKSAKGVDWALALVAGLVGSFIGGLLISLLSGDGLQFRPSGIIGSLVGALLVTAGWQWYRRRSTASHP